MIVGSTVRTIQLRNIDVMVNIQSNNDRSSERDCALDKNIK